MKKSVFMKEEVHKRLKVMAAEEGISMVVLIRRLVLAEWEKREEEGK